MLAVSVSGVSGFETTILHVDPPLGDAAPARQAHPATTSSARMGPTHAVVTGLEVAGLQNSWRLRAEHLRTHWFARCWLSTPVWPSSRHNPVPSGAHTAALGHLAEPD